MKKWQPIYKLALIFAVVYILTFIALWIKPSSKEAVLLNQIETLLIQKDSLKKEIIKAEAFSIKLEQELNQKIQSTEINYQKQLAEITKKYDKERQRIKNLPLDRQAEVLAFNLKSISTPIRLQTIDKDTTIIINAAHAENINQTYLERQYLLEKDTLCEASRDSLQSILILSQKTIDSKNNEISLFKQLSSVDNKTILDLNKTIAESRKTTRKRIWRTALISTSIGIVSGIVLTSL